MRSRSGTVNATGLPNSQPAARRAWASGPACSPRQTLRVPRARMTSGGYSAPATVWAFGLPRYTPTERPAVLARPRPPSPSATAANASSQRRLGQHAVATDQRRAQPVGVVVELAEACALGADEPGAEHVVAVPAGGDHPTVLDGQRQSAGGLTERADAQGSVGHACILRSGVFVHLRIEGSDVGQVAVALGVIKAVPDDELVRDVEADVLRCRRRRAPRRACAATCTPAASGAPRVARLRSSHDSVSPESTMSSTISTSRSLMSRSRSLRMRTTPDDDVDEP